MDTVITGFLERNLPAFIENITVELTGEKQDKYSFKSDNNHLFVQANNYVAAFIGIYDYLKKFCNVQLSWCGNRTINISELADTKGEFSRVYELLYA